MESAFWHQIWSQGFIGFHEYEVNPFLKNHIQKLQLNHNDRIFIPLCGKTRDIAWLLEAGFRVVGIELSELAVNQLFSELNITPTVTPNPNHLHFSAKNIDIFVGDIFNLSSEYLGEVNAIYDRAALVALPLHMRKKYTSHLMKITKLAPQLLITYEYDSSKREGPPFSIMKDELMTHYYSRYHLTSIASEEVIGGLKGNIESTSRAWLIA
jgi:thiopurine S-methyltransferase